MKNKLERVTVDEVNLQTVRWTNYANKVCQREMILLILHQKGAMTNKELVKEGFPLYLIEWHLDYIEKKGKVKREEETLKYSRTKSKHKFHYDKAIGRLE